MSSLLGDLSSCIPLASEDTCDDNHGCEIRRIIDDFHTLNDSTVETIEEEEALAASIIERCDRLEAEMIQNVEAGKLIDVPQHKRQAFGAACLVKALTILRPDEASLEKAIYTLDLALLVGMPLQGWHIGRAIDVIHQRLGENRSYTNDKRTLTRCGRLNDDDDYDSDEIEEQLDPFWFKTDHIPRDDIVTEECPSVHTFSVDYLSKNEPVKMIGCMDGWASLVKWKYLGYLKRLAGVRLVPIEMGDYSRGGGMRLITLAEYLDDLSLGKTAPECGYLAQHQLFEQEPRLQQDIVVPDYCALTDVEDITINVWLGPAKTLTPLHNDPQPNILAQVVGRKMVTLFAPEDTPFLYPRTDRLTNNSQVDIRQPDLQKFPLFSSAVPLICTIEPGDMLFIPAGWWHAVESLDVSFSVNFFF